ncbi:MAG: hypothetical protein K8I60_12505, partial [Anaerolineae bacterium]|nr:hypothetical protein [Anaerolineae bacterium]
MTRFRITLQRTLLASLLGLLVISGYVYGQGDVSGGTVSWSQPLKLGDGWWNSIATDREGGVHVAWDAALRNEKGVEIDALIYSAKILGGDWTPANDVIFTGLGGYTVRNALAVGNDGTLYA